MRVLLTSSRTWKDLPSVWSVLDATLFEDPDMVLVHGDCPEGGDAIGKAWAVRNGVPQERHPAKWQNGRSAGLRRNARMVAKGAGRCLAFIRDCEKPGCTRPKPHGTHGASHCADLAEKAGIETRRIPWEGRSGLAETSRDQTSDKE